jgi:thioredoxin reductase (NADPH)
MKELSARAPEGLIEVPEIQNGKLKAMDKTPPLPTTLRVEYDVVIVGGGPAGLSAATLCAKKILRTAIFEDDCWGGVLTRYCPDKQIDNFPGTSRGILAKELAALLVGDARSAGADLFLQRVEEITREGILRTEEYEVTGKVMILACGSTTAEANIPGEGDLAAAGFVHYKVPDPSLFHAKRVVVIGGGDTAISHVRRLLPFAEQITLIHRKPTLRSIPGIPDEAMDTGNPSILLGARVEKILGSTHLEGVLVSTAGVEASRCIPADDVVMATGRMPNSFLLRNLGLKLDSKGHVVTDMWQKTCLPGILAVGDVSSHLKMIITAVAQAAVASHEAYIQIRKPYWGE